MSTLIYFVPRENPVPIQSYEQLVAAGIGHADPDRLGGHANKTLSGPGGLGGLLWSQKLANGDDGPEPRYDAATQVWRKHPSGAFWVGYLKDAKPTPETLARKEVVGSNLVELMDKHHWTVPICCPSVWNDSTTDLPQQYDLDEAGELVGTVPSELRPIADRVFDVFCRYLGERPWAKGASERRAEVNADVNLAADLLAMNYRVGRFEATALLGLFGSKVYFNVLRAAFDGDKVDEALKKIARSPSDASVTSSGGTDAPAAPTDSVT